MTSTARLVESVRFLLSSRLPPLLTAAGLPPVTEFLGYDPPVSQATKAPQVWVEIAEERPDGPAAMGGVNAIQTLSRRILVGVVAAGPDPAAASLQLRGCVDLVRSVILTERVAGGEGIDVRYVRTAYTANRAVTGGLLKGATLIFDVWRWGPYGAD